MISGLATSFLLLPLLLACVSPTVTMFPPVCCRATAATTNLLSRCSLFLLQAQGRRSPHPGGSSRGASAFPSLTAYNSLTRSIEPLDLGDGSEPVSWYTCGPTVYDSAHLGHARTYVVLDSLRRIVERHVVSGSGGSVHFAMGLTDVDDKIIARSAQLHTSMQQLTQRYEGEFREDMAALNVLQPTVTLRVTEHMDRIVDMVRDILAAGLAYEAADGVYFDTLAMGPRYGSLMPAAGAAAADSDAEEAAPERGDGVKRNPRDFALWKKAAASGQLAGVGTTPMSPPSWDSPWGPGRPGWHIECSAMATSVFGRHLHLHSGGIDLAFPHHCNEIAQCEAALFSAGLPATSAGGSSPLTGALLAGAAEGTDHGIGSVAPSRPRNNEWCRAFLHTGHLHIAGRKMSKSLKNFITIREMLGDVQRLCDDASGGHPVGTAAAVSALRPADVFRLFCLSHRYRSNVSYSADRLVEAASRLRKTQAALRDVSLALQHLEAAPAAATRPVQRWSPPDAELYRALGEARRAVRASLHDDFDTPEAVSVLVRFVAALQARALPDAGSSGDGAHPRKSPPAGLLGEGLRFVAAEFTALGFQFPGPLLAEQPSGAPGATAQGAGEQAAQSIVELRTQLRSIALALRGAGAGEPAAAASRELLAACDQLRDGILPSLGWGVKDAKEGPKLSRLAA